MTSKLGPDPRNELRLGPLTLEERRALADHHWAAKTTPADLWNGPFDSPGEHRDAMLLARYEDALALAESEIATLTASEAAARAEGERLRELLVDALPWLPSSGTTASDLAGRIIAALKGQDDGNG